jgi:hypothetical protein
MARSLAFSLDSRPYVIAIHLIVFDCFIKNAPVLSLGAWMLMSSLAWRAGS